MSKAFDFNVRGQLLNYAANDILTTKTLYNKMCELKQKRIKNVIFNGPATIVMFFVNGYRKKKLKKKDYAQNANIFHCQLLMKLGVRALLRHLESIGKGQKNLT